MSNINLIIYESFSDHLKKHWKKYALGATLAGLGVGGYAAKDKIKNLIKPKKTSFGKKIAIGAGLMGAGYIGNKTYHGIKAYKLSKSVFDVKDDGTRSVMATYHLSHLPNFIGHKIINAVAPDKHKVTRTVYDNTIRDFKQAI